jgi:prepilin-type N-terminal cleavage/methylation domain-containing protein
MDSSRARFQLVRAREERCGGFSLLEVMVALGILAIGVVGMTAGQVLALKVSSTSRSHTMALDLAEEQMEVFEATTAADVLTLVGSPNDPDNPIMMDPGTGVPVPFTRSWEILADTPEVGVIQMTVMVGPDPEPEGGPVMRRVSTAGFTTIELMVALGIMAVVTVQVLAVMTSQQQTYYSQKRVIEVQQDARLISDMMVRDVRMAGFMVPTLAGISSRDGLTTGSDTLCTSDAATLDDTQVANANARFDGAPLTSDLNGGLGSVAIASADMDIDGDTANDFAPGSGIIISDGADNHCARVLTVNATDITFTPSTPGGFVANTPAARALPAVIYEHTGSNLTRNNELISPQVEDFQVEFHVDADDNGVISGGETTWIHGLTANTDRVREVRLSVLTRTAQADPLMNGNGRQGVANRNGAGARDQFRRRLVTVRVAPRNML